MRDVLDWLAGRRWLLLGVVVVAAMLWSGAVYGAPRRCRTARVNVVRARGVSSGRVHVQSQALVSAVVPFAVPVAVPVATIAVPGVFYRYQAAEFVAEAAEDAEPLDRVALPSDGGEVRNGKEEVAESSVGRLPEREAIDAEAERIMRQRCATCHRDGNASGGWSLDGVDVRKLDRRRRLEIVRRLTTNDEQQRMPRSGRVSDEEIRVLLEALVR